MPLVTIIGRGHSGTRAISHTLYASGVYMGNCLNASGDLILPDDIYAACNIIAEHVGWAGAHTWQFDELHTMDIPQAFTDLFYRYIDSVLREQEKHPDRLCGWKIPETTLVFPWVRRLLPDTKYIFWVRDPRDSILGRHITDDLARFGIPHEPIPDSVEGGELLRRATSWKYQYDLVRATPQPKHWLEVRFEDFVLHQEATLQKLEDFLEVPLARIIVRPDAVGRWRRTDAQAQPALDFIQDALRENNYLHET